MRLPNIFGWSNSQPPNQQPPTLQAYSPNHPLSHSRPIAQPEPWRSSNPFVSMLQNWWNSLPPQFQDAIRQLAQATCPVVHPIGKAIGVPEGNPGMQLMKPAVYFYPTETIDVQLTLCPSIELSIDIPTYHPQNGWKVRAYPDGRLEDLQPELTNLSNIDTDQFGFEYLNEVKANGVYPYIYWDGKQMDKPLPTITSGWRVSTDELGEFFDTVLTKMGLSTTEMADFVSYWQPKLSQLPNATHFNIGFMMTDALQAYCPAYFTPQPDTLFRMLMLIEVNPIAEKILETQNLTRFNRNGFTVVEWGGSFVTSPNYPYHLQKSINNSQISV